LLLNRIVIDDEAYPSKAGWNAGHFGMDNDLVHRHALYRAICTRISMAGSVDFLCDRRNGLDHPSQTGFTMDGNRQMARVTGLEPATSGVTGRRSNQLSYTRISAWRRRD
jgi:hypothetical protein